MRLSEQPVAIVGAGPSGALLAILLQRRGMRVTLYEKRGDPRDAHSESGRSINLALADRGLQALAHAGVLDEISADLMPMRGRLIHHLDGTTALQPYGQRPHEINHSVSRHRLNQVLLDVAARQPGIRIYFEHRLQGVDFQQGMAQFQDIRHGRLHDVAMRPMLACDGAGSMLRRCMSTAGFIYVQENDLAHGYKELSIPAGVNGEYRMAADALHIWPRGGYMLIALPNTDGSFTATLFLPKHGAHSFESLTDPAAVNQFFSETFADVRALMPNCVAEFCGRATGFLGTVYANPWHYRGMAALIGDAAHAIVPFHGQGMNCCFEDCVEFDASAARHSSWESLFAEFESSRKPNTDAIAAMALENYQEMSELVAHPDFQLQQALALELERRHPQRFIPRYSMVMFHHEIPYQIARQRGTVQSQILTDLTIHATQLGDIDFGRAAREIESKLTPLA